MKTIKALTLALAAGVLFSFSTTANNLDFEVNEYAIEEMEVATTTASSLQTEGKSYVIHYEAVDKPMRVFVKENETGKQFIVKGENFELQYQVKGKAFGVSYLNEEEASISKNEMYTKLNRTAFLHQKVITQNPYEEKEYVELIASYLPQLIK